METTVEAYLATSFEDGDREYLDGKITENHGGELDHAATQTAIGAFFSGLRRRLRLHCVLGCRTHVGPTRFRLPDLAVIFGDRPKTPVLELPPFLVVELLSPDDRAALMQERIDDYLRFGVPWIWVINPTTGRGHIYTSQSRVAVEDGIYRTASPDIEMNFHRLFD